MSHSGAPQELPPLKGTQLAITSVAIALGTFMMVLDTTIANVALPTVAGNLGTTSDQGTWIITSFAVSNGVAVPLTGWLAQRYGLVRTFVVAVILFTLASFLCGIAWSLPVLIVFRIFQGAVAGPMMPGSQALLISIFPPQKRAIALSIWSITTLVAPVIGPVAGGYIVDNFNWGWIFLINVPVGLLTAFLCWTNLANRETPTRQLPIDMVGLGLLISWVGTLQVMLDTGKDADWFQSPQIVILAIISVLSFISLIIWELTVEHPIIDLRLFRNRNFALGNLSFCLGYAIFFANVLLMPLWLQTNVGYTATWAGLVSVPSGFVAVLMTPIAARMMPKVDARWMATIAFAAFALSYFMRSGLTTDARYWNFAVTLLAQGVAMSMFFVSMLTISLDGIPPEKIPSASGILNFARITAGGFAASLITTMWDRREAFHQTRLTDTSSAYNPIMQQAMAHLHSFGFTDLQSYGVLTRNMVSQAYLLASDDLFWISGWLSLAMILVVWTARRAVSGGNAPMAAD
jgi:DHA2 family multidrug resistance protein